MSKNDSTRDSEGESLGGWQKRLLPFMVWTVVILGAFFFIASFAQLVYLQLTIVDGPQGHFERYQQSAPEFTALNFDQQMAVRTHQANLTLEFAAMERRHHQANVLVMARIWARYLGFVTGMILTFMGAVFVLGKLDSSPVKLEGGSLPWVPTLETASPGIVLAVLGVAMMLATIVTSVEIEVTDSPLYMNEQTGKPALSPRTTATPG